MKKAVTTVHTILVVAIIIATAGWSAYYIYNQRNINSEVFTEKIPVFAKEVSNLFIENDSLYNNDFSDKIKGIFEENSELTALTIYSYDTGVEYFYSRNNQIKIKSQGKELSSKDPMPEYSGVGFFYRNRIGSIPLNLVDKPGSNLDCIFTVLPRGSVFFVLKISLIVIILLFAVTLLLIIIFSLSSGRGSDPEKTDVWSPQDQSFEGASETDATASGQENQLGIDPQESLDDFNFPEDEESGVESSDSFDNSFLDEEDSSFNTDMSDNLDIPEDEPLDFDDMNLEDSIPDIPEEEDLLAMAHEEVSIPANESLDDFDVSSLDDAEEDLSDITHFDDLPEEPDTDQSSLYNPDSGLGWEHFLEERLSLELERAASFDQDLVLLIVRNSQIENDTWEQLTAAIKEKYSYSDLVFEAGKNELAVIEPNKDLDESIKDVQGILNSVDVSIVNDSTFVGLSSRNGRLISGNRLIREAGTSLNKADTENPIVGFRSDPERFRKYLENSH